MTPELADDLFTLRCVSSRANLGLMTTDWSMKSI